MLTNDMKFPAEFKLDRDYLCAIIGVVQGVVVGGPNTRPADLMFYGHTTLDSDRRSSVPCVWDVNGKCVLRMGPTPTADPGRNLKLVVPGQRHYNSLSTDQRAILKLLVGSDRYASSYPNQYLIDTLAVMMGDTDDIIDYAIKKEFK